NREIGDREVSSLDVDEQGRRQHLRGQGAQQARLTDTGGTDDQYFGAGSLRQSLIGADDLHRCASADLRCYRIIVRRFLSNAGFTRLPRWTRTRPLPLK